MRLSTMSLLNPVEFFKSFRTQNSVLRFISESFCTLLYIAIVILILKLIFSRAAPQNPLIIFDSKQ